MKTAEQIRAFILSPAGQQAMIDALAKAAAISKQFADAERLDARLLNEPMCASQPVLTD